MCMAKKAMSVQIALAAIISAVMTLLKAKNVSPRTCLEKGELGSKYLGSVNDNLIKRNWKGHPYCFFCDQPESVNHLLFNCCVSRTVQAIIATCLGATDIPLNTSQSRRWCKKWLPGGGFFSVGIAAIYWAIWKSRNKACFNGKLLKNPSEIICHASALMRFWAGLQRDEDKTSADSRRQRHAEDRNPTVEQAFSWCYQASDATG